MRKLTFRISEVEYQALLDYCQKTERTQTDILRECVRFLGKSLKPDRVPIVLEGTQPVSELETTPSTASENLNQPGGDDFEEMTEELFAFAEGQEDEI